MKENLKPGTMGAAEAKSTKRFFIGATIIITAILLVFVVPFNVTSIVGFPHAWFVRAAVVSKIFGFLVFAAWLVFLWAFSYDVGWGKKTSAIGVSVALLIALALMVAFFAGFNFDLNGIG